MPIPPPIQSHVLQKFYNDSPIPRHHELSQSPLSSDQQIHLPDTIPPRYSSPQPHSTLPSRLRPSPSVHKARYSVFPPPSKQLQLPPYLLRPRPGLLPLISKFDALDAEGLLRDRSWDRELTPRPLKLKRRDMWQVDVEQGLKARADGLTERVRGLLECSERGRGAGGGRMEGLEEQDTEISIGEHGQGHTASQRLTEIIAIPKATLPSWTRQHNPVFPPIDLPAEVAVTRELPRRPSSRGRKDPALGPRRDSQLRDRIRFFDGSTEPYSKEPHISEMRADAIEIGTDSSALSTKHHSIIHTMRSMAPLIKKVDNFKEPDTWKEHYNNVRNTSWTRICPQYRADFVHEARRGSGSRERVSIETFPPDYNSSPVRESNRDRTRERVLCYESVINPANPSHHSKRLISPKSLLGAAPNESDSLTHYSPDEAQHEIERQIVELYMSLPIDRKVNSVGPGGVIDGLSGGMGMISGLENLLLPQESKLTRALDNLAIEDLGPKGENRATLDQNVENIDDTFALDAKKPRGDSMVQQRIRQFSFGPFNSCRTMNSFKILGDIGSKEQAATSEGDLARLETESITREPSITSPPKLRTDINGKPPETRLRRLTTIKSKIKLFEDYTNGRRHRGSNSKEAKVPSINNETGALLDKGMRFVTTHITDDVGISLQHVERTPALLPTQESTIVDTGDAVPGSKAKISQWWKESREVVPTVLQRQKERGLWKSRSRGEKISRRATRRSPEKVERRDSAIYVNNVSEDLIDLGSATTRDLARNGPTSRTVSPEVVKEIWIHSRAQSPYLTHSLVETQSNGTRVEFDSEAPLSKLKLVLEQRRNGSERKRHPDLDANVVNTVVAQCELTQPRPRRLAELQRMMLLCKSFAENDWNGRRGVAAGLPLDTKGKENEV